MFNRRWSEPGPPSFAGPAGERLVAHTVRAATRIALDQAPPSQVLGRRAVWLVAEAMRALAQERWRLVLLLGLTLGTPAIGQPQPGIAAAAAAFSAGYLEEAGEHAA